MYTNWKGFKNRVESIFGSCKLVKIWAHNCLLKMGILRQFWSFQALLTDFYEFEETIVSSNLDQIAWTKDGFYSIFKPLSSGVHEFCYKTLQAYLCSAESTVETISIIFPYLVIVYPQIQNPITLIYMSTTYLESFGADLTKKKPFQCVSRLLTGRSTCSTTKQNCWKCVYEISVNKISCHIMNSWDLMGMWW